MLFLSYICARCGSTAAWRNSLIAKYPNDVSRNTTARDLLQALAVMSEDDVSDETKAALAKIAGGPEFAQVVQESCRLVGFRYVPQSLEDVVLDIVARSQPEAAPIVTSGTLASVAHDHGI